MLYAFLLLFACGKGISVYAQIKGYTVRNIGSHQGLPSSEIFELFQDSKGFVWVGTNAGFSRYDGYVFDNFQYVNNHRIGLVNRIRETKDQKLWICTESGLFVFDNNVLHEIKLTNEKNYAPFFDLVETKDGSLIIACSRGLLQIPSNKRQALLQSITNLENFKLQGPGDSLKGVKGAIRFLSTNNDGDLLMASYAEVFLKNKKGIFKLWQSKEQSDDVSCVYIDSIGRCTWGTTLIGVNSWRDGKFSSFNETNTRLLYGAYSLLPKKDRLVVYSSTNIFNYYPEQDRFDRLFHIMPLNIKWSTVMLVDDKENYWIGSHEGLFLIRKNPFSLYPPNTHKALEEVYSINQFKDGKIVAGTNRGRLYEIRDTAAIPYLNDKTAFPKAEVFSSFTEEPGIDWFGSGYQGISVLKNGHVQNFQIKDGLADNTVSDFLKDSKGRLWAIGDNGMTEIIQSPSTDSIRFRALPLSSGNAMDVKLYKAIEGPDNRIWVAGSKGIMIFDGNKFQEYSFNKEFPKAIYCNHILKDKNNNVWISSSDYGIFLCAFDEKNNLQVKKAFNLQDGLPANTFISATIDKDNNFWAVSYGGLSCIQQIGSDNYLINNFNQKDGIELPNYYHPSLFNDKSGLIWISTSCGVVSFEPKKLLQKRMPVPVYVTKVDMTGTDSTLFVFEDGRQKLSTHYFNYNNNNITIHFTALHYQNPDALHYYYRIGNKDSNWVELKNSRTVSFRSLPPGNYLFQLKAAIGGNEFSPITNFSFTIEPPFWKRSWFVIPVITLLSLLSFLLIKRREKAISEREAQKTELQKLKTISYQYQLEIEQVINYFATSMNEQRTVDDMLWDVSRNCISKLGFEDCVIYLKNPYSNQLIQKAAWGPKTTKENKIVNPIEIPVGKGIVGTVAATGKAEIINDTSMDPRYIVDDSRRYSELTVPIIEKGVVIGVIDSEHSQKYFYTGRHLQILSTIASLLGEKMDKMKTEQDVRDREIQLITLNRDLATSQLTALRAQMNPHFIFNALNSIQQYILKGDVDQAHKYLSKFSKLQREVLNHCDQNFISLDKEIEMLNLYLELEQLRFSDNFDYSITLDNEIDPAEIRIPPMILQPFVENAIWHGLMPKKSDRRLSIEFALRTDELIQCIVRDNGIGRAAAARIKEEKSKNQPGYKSKGLQLVHERLEILRQQYQQPFEVQFSDLTNPAGEVQGTSVSLILYIGQSL